MPLAPLPQSSLGQIYLAWKALFPHTPSYDLLIPTRLPGGHRFFFVFLFLFFFEMNEKHENSDTHLVAAAIVVNGKYSA
jgi:hypothetical protein